MAERTSTRAGSRRATPQPAPQDASVGIQSPPRQTTRTTRSQSRDISDTEGKRGGTKARKGAKQATPDATNNGIGKSGPQNQKGRSANRARIQQDLSVVEEDPSVIYPHLDIAGDTGVLENVKDAGAGPQSTKQNPKSPGDFSAFSGTTARISSSTQELTRSSLEDLLDTLPDLSDSSDKLLNFVLPADLSEASLATAMARLQRQGTRDNKKLKRLGDTFLRQRKEYGGDSFISVGNTLRRLLGREIGPIDEQNASWRPDALFQKANLAVLVLRLLSIAEQKEKDQDLEDIAGTFPQPFAQRLGLAENVTPECSALAEATFHMALEVRTQEAIMLLARHVGRINFDPNTALLQVFYDANDLKGWTVSGLQAKDLRKEDRYMILARVKDLREAFRFDEETPSDRQSSGVDFLRVNFPWTIFAQRMVAWAGQRLDEIRIQTSTHGGAQTICQKLGDEIQSSTFGQSGEGDEIDYDSDSPNVRLDLIAPSESRATSEPHADGFNLPPFSGSSNKSRSFVVALKEREANRKVTKQSDEINPFVQVASTAGPTIRSLSPQRNPSDETITGARASVTTTQVPLADQYDDELPEGELEREEDINMRRNAQESLAFRTQREAENNKENLGEIPDSQHNTTAKKRSMYDRDPLAERVPSISSQDSDGRSSDEDFQRQTESSNAARQRRLKPVTKSPMSERKRRSPKRARVQENIEVQTLDGRTDIAGDRQSPEMPLSQGYQEYVKVNQSAKQNIAVVSKPPQSRKAWASAETDMLYYLITEHGTSWRLLQQEDLAQGHVLEARDQVALKDKARNMKMDYLKAGRVLPQNFERIPLSKLQIERLRDGGIEYDRETGTRVDAEVIDITDE